MAIDRYEDGPDDEIGYRNLCKPPSADLQMVGGLSFYSRDEEIALEAVAVARGNLEAKGLGAYYRRTATCQANNGDSLSVPAFPVSWAFNRLAEARADHQRRLVAFVDEVVGIDVPLLPRPAMMLDYVPYIQRMIQVDDELEKITKLDGEDRSLGRRHVRQSTRLAGGRVLQYERYLTLQGPGSLRAAQDSRFSWGEENVSCASRGRHRGADDMFSSHQDVRA